MHRRSCHNSKNALQRQEVDLITEASLQEKTSRDLAQMAKKKGVQGWHSMRKTQLVKALIKLAKNKERQKRKLAEARAKDTTAKSSAAAKASVSAKASAKTSPLTSATAKPARSKASKAIPESAVAKRIRCQRLEQEKLRDIAFREMSGSGEAAPKADRIVLLVRDAYWLQGYWEVTRTTVERIKVAMGPHWPKAKPVLRLLEISSRGNTNSFESVAQEIPIHGGASNWFINVNDSQKIYRLAIGYVVAANGDESDRFHLIAKSNEVLTMPANCNDDKSWADITNHAEKYYAQSGGYDVTKVSGDLKAVFEEKSEQPMHSAAIQAIPTLSRFGASLAFQVDAHMVIHGRTDPNASVTIAGSPVSINNDGSFVLRMELPNKRQVLPVTASSFDGTQQQTTVLAIERNTKVLEPVNREMNEL